MAHFTPKTEREDGRRERGDTGKRKPLGLRRLSLGA